MLTLLEAQLVTHTQQREQSANPVMERMRQQLLQRDEEMGARYCGARYPSQAFFRAVSYPWVLHRLSVLERHRTLLRVIEVGARRSPLALWLADCGHAVAVANQSFDGAFIEATNRDGREIAIFPRHINFPWTRFFHGIADAVVCIEGLESLSSLSLPASLAEGEGLSVLVGHFGIPLREGGILLIAAQVQLGRYGAGFTQEEINEVTQRFGGRSLNFADTLDPLCSNDACEDERAWIGPDTGCMLLAFIRE